MFLFGYLIVLLIAATPLAATIARNRAAAPSLALVRRVYRDLAYIGAAIVAIVAFETALRVSLEAYWFAEVGQSARYWFSLGLQFAIFGAIFVVGGLFIALNLRFAWRPIPLLPRSVAWIVGFVIAAAIGFGATRLWMPLTAFLGAPRAGVVDPVFGKDIAFYLLRLPFYQALVGLAQRLVIVAALGWAAAGAVVLGGLRRRLVLVAQRDATAPDAIERRFFAARPVARDAWVRHGCFLGALFCLCAAAGAFLARYRLVVSGHSRVVAGAAWIDTHVWMWAYAVFVAAWLIAAVGLAAAAFAPGVRRALLTGRRGVGAAAALVAACVIAAIIPAFVENLFVGPNQITLEQPYLLRTIAGTRAAFGLEGPSVDEQEFQVSAKPVSGDDLAANATTLRDARIWDWRALAPQLQQTQGLRPYYAFGDVDIDRYLVDGAERQVMITARELDVEKLPPQAQVWVNLALKYTHGYGVVAVPVNQTDAAGNPVLWAHDIPIEAKGELAVTHGEIYYGMQTNDRVYVHTTEKEFDYPRGDTNAESVYGGAGGVPLSNLWRKLVMARAFDGLRLFISGYFTPESRILIRRNVVERAWRLAPFLTFDHDPYIVAAGDHYDWILDGYTSSSNYPYSDAYRGSVAAFGGRNYVRNSVKAVVDAYNGQVTFYVYAPDDPIIAAYRKLLPGLFKDRSEMPANLARHVRYPEDLFTAQAEMYGTYHMTNPTTFYNREDRWEVPRELYRGEENELPPYYVMAQLPKEPASEFVLMLPLSVAGKNQMAGWLAGRSDGANYGKLVAYRFQKGVFIDGPAQVESRISSDSRFSGDLTLWNQQGSSVIRGNLIILPLNTNQLIAIEPVYIEAEQTKIPALARVVFGQLLPDDRKIEWAENLLAAEALVAGEPAPTTLAQGGGAATPAGATPASAPGAPAGASPDRLQRAQAVFKQMQQAYASGDFARAGQLMQQLAQILGS